MKSKQKGISLIVLIVTIIVIIILATSVILTLSKNSPISSANEARFKGDVRTFQDELAMYISKDYTTKGGARDDKVTATSLVDMQKYIPSFSKKYEGKFVIKNDELRYSEDTVVDKELAWCKNLNVKSNAKPGAKKAKESPAEYYGKKVNYTAPNGVNDWKIFYSDRSNVYIITSEFVDPAVEDQLLSKGTGTDARRPDQGDAANYPKAARFNNILSKYSGSANITDEKMKAFNSDYFEKGYTSTNDNMKAVAYMLDKDIWSPLYRDTSFAEYAVGGPSLEMTLKSCSEKKNVDYRAKAANAIGYQISKDGGASWTNNYSGMLYTSETLYVLPSAATSGANEIWLASPSSENGTYVMYVNYGDYVGRLYL